MTTNKLSFCHKLRFSNSYNLATRFPRPLIFQNINSGRSNSFILFGYLATYMYFNCWLYNALKIEPRIGKQIIYTFLKCDMTRGYIYYIHTNIRRLFLTIGLKRFKSNIFLSMKFFSKNDKVLPLFPLGGGSIWPPPVVFFT